MTKNLDLADIQGNIIQAYGRRGFPKARYFMIHIKTAEAGRLFVQNILPKVTNALRWANGKKSAGASPGEKTVNKPAVTLNIGFSFAGLEALDLPTRTLRTMPAEFIDGMRARHKILGDVEHSAPDQWDPVWKQQEKEVHIWCSMNTSMNPNDGTPADALDDQTRWLQQLCEAPASGVEIIKGHGRDDQSLYQEASALIKKSGSKYTITPKEHFGYVDGISDPVFDGQFPPEIMKKRVTGRGKFSPKEGWQPLATGEFLLGHPNESQEISPTSVPSEFMRNGSFMVYRKLHQNVASFNGYIQKIAKEFSQVMGTSEKDAEEIIRAKLIGRWSNGMPLTNVPTLQKKRDLDERRRKAREQNNKEEIAEIERMMTNFTFKDDMEGIHCPFGSHIRRSNTRDMLDPSQSGNSALNKRRRIIRRGLPYGSVESGANRDDGEHGIIFMAICSSLFRQFEFVQQQWIQYGMDFNAGNDTCPVIGHHNQDTKFVIPMDPSCNKPPFICPHLPQFVTMRGGDYFFLPSLTALRMIAMRSIDPT